MGVVRDGETIEEMTARFRPGMVSGVFACRSGSRRPPMPDPEIVRESRRAMARSVRRSERTGKYSAMQAESVWAASLRALDAAMSDPESDPAGCGRRCAESFREDVRNQAREWRAAPFAFVPWKVERIREDFCGDGRDSGPVWREAFLSRLEQVVREESANLCGA